MEQERTPFDPRELDLQRIDEFGLANELPVDFTVRYNQTDSNVLSYLNRVIEDHPELEHWKFWLSHLNSTTLITDWSILEWFKNEITLLASIDSAFIGKKDLKLLMFLESIKDFLILRLMDAWEGHRAKLITLKSARIQYGFPTEQGKKRRWPF